LQVGGGRSKIVTHKLEWAIDGGVEERKIEEKVGTFNRKERKTVGTGELQSLLGTKGIGR